MTNTQQATIRCRRIRAGHYALAVGSTPVGEASRTRSGWYVRCYRHEAYVSSFGALLQWVDGFKPCRDCGSPFPHNPDADRCERCVSDLIGGAV